jgi:hypothetical protein
MDTSTESQAVSHTNLSNNGDKSGGDDIERAEGKIFRWQLKIEVSLPIHLFFSRLNIFTLFSVLYLNDKVDNFLHDLQTQQRTNIKLTGHD